MSSIIFSPVDSRKNNMASCLKYYLILKMFQIVAGEMSTDIVYDLCIVGAGMFGSAAARYASADPNLKICLIGPNEPRKEDYPEREVFGAHYDEGRIVRNLDDNPTRIVLAKNSLKRFRDLEKQSGVHFYNPVGCLFIGQKNGKFLEGVRNASEETQTPLTEISDADEFHEKYPFLSLKDDESALLDGDGAGHISARKLVFLQKKLARRQGCDVINSVVEEIKTISTGVHEIYTETQGSIKANRVLLSTGAYANFIPKTPLEPLSILLTKGTAVLLHVSEEEAHRLRTMPAVIRRRSNSCGGGIGAYILPPIKYPDGKYYLKFGRSGDAPEPVNTLSEVNEWYISGGDKSVVNRTLEFVTDVIPGLQIIDTKTISCVYTYSSTGLPYIDQVSPTVTVAIAGNGRGAKFSDEVGRIAAHLSTTGTWDSVLDRDQFKADFDGNPSDFTKE